MLLRELYDQTKGHGTNRNAEVFDIIGQLIKEQVMPSDVSAALYRAAARIPGGEIVPNAVDAAGRNGVAVTRVFDGERTK